MIVGITGGIGSGKSTVSRLFEIMGCAIFNSDEVANSMYFEKDIQPQVKARLGEEAYVSDSKINKSYIQSCIFTDADLLQKLNGIIHPAVMRKFSEFERESKAKLIIKETALLFEANLQSTCQKIIVVAADDALRLERVMQRDALREEDVLKKMNAQWPQEKKIEKADFVILNNEDSLLIPRVLEIYEHLNSVA